MKRSLLALLFAVVLVAAAPLSALAYTDERPDGSPTPYPIDENTQTTYGTHVTIPLGTQRDLNGFIKTRHTDEDHPLDEWYLVGAIGWKSSDPAAVSVDKNGVATAHKMGAVTVTATAWDNVGKKHVYRLLIGGSAQKTAVSENVLTVFDGARIDLSALLAGLSYQTVRWAVVDPSVVTVDANGLALAKSVGSCVVTGTLTDATGKQSTLRVKIQVKTALLDEKILRGTLVLQPGQEIDMQRLYFPDYQGAHHQLNKLSCSSTESTILACDGLLLSAAAPGTAGMSVSRTEDDQTKRVLYALTVTVAIPK